jgi:hypothetical protein
LQVAAAWGYVEQQAANRIVAALEAFGGRLYGLSRR